MSILGKLAKDKITGFEGIVIGECEYLFGCHQYGLAPQSFNKETGAMPETKWFDEGRVEIMGNGIGAKEVRAERPGADTNHDSPR